MLSCAFFCVPQDLVAFSEKHDIQLLTHADPKGTVYVYERE